MVAKGYTSVVRIEEYLDRKLTPVQSSAANRIMEPAEQWIDRKIGRQYWTAAGNPPLQTVTTERYLPQAILLYLRSRPVASIQSVTSRDVAIGSTPSVLTAGTDYELTDAESGLVLLSTAQIGKLLTFAYTIAGTMPECVRLATTILVAHLLRPALDAESHGAASYQIGNDIRVTIAPHDVPKEVYDALAPVMPSMVFA